MSEKLYKQRTKVLGIPVTGYGDKIWPEVELKKYQLIENMLLAAMKGIESCLFEEGDMTLSRQEDGQFSVALHPQGVTRSAVGILGGTYFSAPPSVEWNNLRVGRVHYLYLAKTPKTFTDPSSVRTLTSEFTKDAKNMLLMGVADLRSDPPTLERYPDEKLYTSDLAEHLVDSYNPHGDTVLQNKLVIVKKLSLEKDAELTIGGVVMPVSSLLPQIIDFTTDGEEGAFLSATSKVVFVQVCRLSGSEGNLGEVSIGYYGQDDKVANENSFVVYNVGDSAISMRAIVHFG